nr:hypothetical protein [Tanacetum cinerariifolium]
MPEHPSDTKVFTVKMEILLEPMSNKLLVGTLSVLQPRSSEFEFINHMLILKLSKSNKDSSIGEIVSPMILQVNQDCNKFEHIIMESIPPPNNNPNAPEEEPILDQALAALVGFAPQWIGGQIPDNNNGWLEEDPKEEPEEEEIENENMVNDEEDEAKIDDADDVPIPPVIQFGSNFQVGESSAMRNLLAGNSEVYAPGPMCCDLKSVHRGVKRLSNQMHDRYRTEKKMAKKLRQDKLRMNGQEFDITALDSAVRENRSENSKMMKLITGLSREFTELKNQNRRAEELSRWEV